MTNLLTQKDREAYVKMMSFDPRTKTCPNVFISLVFNVDGLSEDKARRTLKDFWTKLCNIGYGQNWQVNKAIAPAWFISEHAATNIHFHGLARFTRNFQDRVAIKAKTVEKTNVKTGKVTEAKLFVSPRIEILWKELAKAGSIEIRRIDDLNAAVGYVLKDVKTFHDASRIMTAPHFEAGLR